MCYCLIIEKLDAYVYRFTRYLLVGSDFIVA
jgi:hypothetical protein